MADHPRHRRVPFTPAEIVASFATWDEAQRAIDFLADRRVPLRHLTVVTRELQLVARGPLGGYARTIMARAESGAISGAFVGCVLGILVAAPPATSPLVLGLSGVTLGAVGGGLLGFCQRAWSRRAIAHDLVRSVKAGRYDLMATAGAADTARRLLHELVG